MNFLAQCKTFVYTSYNDAGAVSRRRGFGIGKIPERTQLALYLVDRDKENGHTVVRPVAYFKNEEDAILFQEIFHQWAEQPYTVKGA